jgi:D-alanine transaminase
VLEKIKMTQIVYINGEFVPKEKATVSVFDRGFLFGDGVYEVIPVIHSALVDKESAMQRLDRSLAAVNMAWPCAREACLPILEQLRSRNNIEEGLIYLQVTRGIADRDFAYPLNTATTFFAFASSKKIIENPLLASGVEVVSVEDLRWKRRDVKSISLLAQCIAKQQAASLGAFEGWLVEDNLVTEGASSSAFIVKDNTIITRELSNAILPGIRRRMIINLAEKYELNLLERPFSLEEAFAADEAFLSSAGNLILPVVAVDGHRIGTGKPGPVTLRLRKLYVEMLLREAAESVH